MVKYEYSESLQVLAKDVATRIFPNVKSSRIKCYKSREKSEVASKIHCLGDIMQHALGIEPFYVLEFFSQFNDLSTEEKAKAVIHKLMYISDEFGRGFREKGFVTQEKVDGAFEIYMNCRKEDINVNFFDYEF